MPLRSQHRNNARIEDFAATVAEIENRLRRLAQLGAGVLTALKPA